MGRKNILMGFEIFILDKLCSTTRSPCVCSPVHSFLFPPTDLPCTLAWVTCVSAPCPLLLSFHLSDLLFALEILDSPTYD